MHHAITANMKRRRPHSTRLSTSTQLTKGNCRYFHGRSDSDRRITGMQQPRGGTLEGGKTCMAWNELEQLKADASERQPHRCSSTRLRPARQRWPGCQPAIEAAGTAEARPGSRQQGVANAARSRKCWSRWDVNSRRPTRQSKPVHEFVRRIQGHADHERPGEAALTSSASSRRRSRTGRRHASHTTTSVPRPPSGRGSGPPPLSPPDGGGRPPRVPLSVGSGQ